MNHDKLKGGGVGESVRNAQASGQTKGKRKTGRPSGFTEEIAVQICERMREGESARSICRSEGMPSWSMLGRWLEANEVFREQYARARSMMVDAWVMEARDISNDESRDYQQQTIRKELADGGVEITTKVVSDNTAVMRDRLRTDTVKWIASKLEPKKYGEMQKVELTGADGGAIQYKKVVDRPPAETPEQWQARVQKEIEARAKAQREQVH